MSAWRGTTRLTGCSGSYFRRVELKSPERGGILTQSGILMVTSYPTRTSPVLRGKWILESLLGAPPPPPPPDVPDSRKAPWASAHEPARAAGEASRQYRLRGLPCAHGPAGLLAGKLRPHRPLPHHRGRRAHRRFRLAARRCAGKRTGRPEEGPARPQRSVRRIPWPRSCSPTPSAAAWSTTISRPCATSAARPPPTTTDFPHWCWPLVIAYHLR